MFPMSEPIELAAIAVETLPAPAVLADAELTPAFVAPFNVMSENGRIFLAFKKQGQQRVSYFEFVPPATLLDLGMQTGPWIKSDTGGIGFWGPNNKPYFFSTETPTTTGGDCRLVVSDDLPLTVGPLPAGGTGITQAQLDAALAPIRWELAQLRAQKLDARMDAVGAAAAALALAAKG
jgi:hypothetical protein